MLPSVVVVVISRHACVGVCFAHILGNCCLTEMEVTSTNSPHFGQTFGMFWCKSENFCFWCLSTDGPAAPQVSPTSPAGCIADSVPVTQWTDISTKGCREAGMDVAPWLMSVRVGPAHAGEPDAGWCQHRPGGRQMTFPGVIWFWCRICC